MSFAADVKKGLTDLEVHREHAKAELAALLRMNDSLGIVSQQFILNVQIGNAAIARRTYSLSKDHYQVRSELLVRKKMKLKKNNVYIVRLKQGTKDVLMDLDAMDGMIFNGHVSDEVMGNSQKIRSYLRGVFVTSDSVNNPKTSRYHLEMFSVYEQHSQDICDMLNYYGLHARTFERRNGYISCLKGAEKIADFLTLTSATNSMLRFEGVRIVQDMRNSVNCLVNYETTNLNKMIDTASKQIENTELVEAKVGLHTLPEKLQEVAELWLQHPEVSLKELKEMIPSGTISKSGINHRIRKIGGFAEKLREEAVQSNVRTDI